MDLLYVLESCQTNRTNFVYTGRFQGDTKNDMGGFFTVSFFSIKWPSEILDFG